MEIAKKCGSTPGATRTTSGSVGGEHDSRRARLLSNRGPFVASGPRSIRELSASGLAHSVGVASLPTHRGLADITDKDRGRENG